MNPPRVLSVGQCGADTGSIARFLRDAFAARAETADTAAEAIDAVRSGDFDLVLVNRVLDLDGSSGLDLIRAIKADPTIAPVATMLVSNYADAQAHAIALGAVAGFGKSDLGRPKARDAVAAAIARETPA